METKRLISYTEVLKFGDPILVDLPKTGFVGKPAFGVFLSKNEPRQMISE